MLIIYLCFLIGLVLYTNKKPKQTFDIIKLEKELSGMDERPINNQSDCNLSTIRHHFFKMDVLNLLQSDSLDDNKKLAMIYNVAFLDDLNPNILRAGNLTKGLKW